MADFLILMVIGIWTALVAFIWFDFGYDDGHSEGMIDVASGTYICELVETDDLTTEWECTEQ